MFKKTVTWALICLSVLPLNTLAASSAEIAGLVKTGQIQAEKTIQEKIEANQKLVAEITDLENQLKTIKSDANRKRDNMNRDLVIAAGTTLATTIAVLYLGRRGQSEVGAEINYGIRAASLVLGSIFTIQNLGSGGYNYLLLQLDEEKIPQLETKLAELKAELEEQTAALLK